MTHIAIYSCFFTEQVQKRAANIEEKNYIQHYAPVQFIVAEIMSNNLIQTYHEREFKN